MKDLPLGAEVDYGEELVDSFTELPTDAAVSYDIPMTETISPQVALPAQVAPPVTPIGDVPSYGQTAVDRLEEFPSNIASSLSKRNQELGATQAAYDAGDINVGEWALQTVGKGLFGTLADIAGETAATVLSAMTPDEAEEKIKQLAASGANTILGTDSAKELLKFYGELDDSTRKNLESAANILAVYAPKGIGTVGRKVKNSGKASAILKKKELLKKTALDNSPRMEKARALDKGVVKYEDDMLTTLLDVPRVKPGGSPAKNITAIQAEMGRLDGKLLKGLSGIKANPIDSRVFKKWINNKVKVLEDNPAYADTSLKPVFKTIDNLLFNDKVGYVGNRSLTPSDILKIRRSLDKGLKKLRGGAGDSSKMFIEKGANGDIIRTYRDALNDAVDYLARDSVIDTKRIRGRQSHLMSAMDNLAGHVGKHKTLTQKVTNYAINHPFTVGAAVSGGGLLATPGVQVLGGGLLTGLAAQKAMTSPLTRMGVGGLLQSQIPTGVAAAGLYGGQEEVPPQR